MILWEGPLSVKLKSTQTSDENLVIKSAKLPAHLAGETNVVELWSRRPLRPLMAFNVPISSQRVDDPLPPASQRDIATLALLGSSPDLIRTTKVSKTALWQFEKVITPSSFHRLLSHLTTRLRLGQSPYRVLVGPPHAPPCALVFHTSRGSLEAVYSSECTYLGVLNICNFLVALLAADDTPSQRCPTSPVFTGSAQTPTGRYWIERGTDISAIVYYGRDGGRWFYRVTGTTRHHEMASMILRGWLAIELSGELYRPRNCGVVSVANAGDCTGGDVGCCLKELLRRFVPLASGVDMETSDMWLVPDTSQSVSFYDASFSILQLLTSPNLSEDNIETLRILNKLSETCSSVPRKDCVSAESIADVSTPYVSITEVDTADTSPSEKSKSAALTRQGSLVFLMEREEPPSRGWSGVLPLTPEIGCEVCTSVTSASSMLQELDLLCMSGSEDESSQGVELPIRITEPESSDLHVVSSGCWKELPSDWSITESLSEAHLSKTCLALSTASRDWEAQSPSPRANRVQELFWNLRKQVPNSAETLFSEISADLVPDLEPDLEPEVEEPSTCTDTPSSQGPPTWPAVCHYTYGLPVPPQTSDFWNRALSVWNVSEQTPTCRPKVGNECTFEPFPLHASRLMLDATRKPLHRMDVASMMQALRKPGVVREPGSPDYLRGYDGEESKKNQLRSIRADLLHVTGLLDLEDVPADILELSRDLLYLLSLKLHESVRN